MKNVVMDYSKLTSDDLLELALRSKNNAKMLFKASESLKEKHSSKNYSLFLVYTASEELQKGLFCMFAHRGIMSKTQLKPIFKQHYAKVMLFNMIFRNPKFYVKNGRFYYGEILFKDLDIRKLLDEDKKLVEKYNTERESCLYVEPEDDGSSYDPSKMIVNVESRRVDLIDKMTYLDAIFKTVWSFDFGGDVKNFDYYTKRPTAKPKDSHFTFSGTGDIVKRKDFYPDSVRERMGMR